MPITPGVYDREIDKSSYAARTGDIFPSGGLTPGGGGDNRIRAEDVLYSNTNFPLLVNVKLALDYLLANSGGSHVSLTASLSNSVGEVEIGTIVNNVDLLWSYNKDITSQGVSPGHTPLATSIRSLSLTGLGLTYPTAWTLTASDGTDTIYAGTALAFTPRVYWGTSATASPTAGTILALQSSELRAYRQQSRTFDGGGAYLYFAWPSSYGTPNFMVNGFPVFGWPKTTVNLTNLLGYTQSYDIYRSENAQFGSGIPVVVT